MSHKNLGPIGSAVLTFIGHKQTDKPNLYIDCGFSIKVTCAFLDKKKLTEINPFQVRKPHLPFLSDKSLMGVATFA